MSHTIELAVHVVLLIVDILTVMFLLPAIYKCNNNNSFFVHAFTVQALMLWVAHEQT
jgi:hypothetical protein